MWWLILLLIAICLLIIGRLGIRHRIATNRKVGQQLLLQTRYLEAVKIVFAENGVIEEPLPERVENAIQYLIESGVDETEVRNCLKDALTAYQFNSGKKLTAKSPPSQ